MNSPLGESRGGTPTGVRALQGARRTERCGTCKLASAGVPLPFLYFSFLACRALIVMEPVTTAGSSDEDRARSAVLCNGLLMNSGANKKTRRENDHSFPSPVTGREPALGLDPRVAARPVRRSAQREGGSAAGEGRHRDAERAARPLTPPSPARGEGMRSVMRGESLDPCGSVTARRADRSASGKSKRLRAVPWSAPSGPAN